MILILIAKIPSFCCVSNDLSLTRCCTVLHIVPAQLIQRVYILHITYISSSSLKLQEKLNRAKGSAKIILQLHSCKLSNALKLFRSIREKSSRVPLHFLDHLSELDKLAGIEAAILKGGTQLFCFNILYMLLHH